MAQRICRVEGCEKPVTAKRSTLCPMHRSRLQRHGDFVTVLPTGGVRPGNGFKPGHKINVGERSARWLGDNAGYGAAHERVRVARGRPSVHRCVCGEQAKHWAYKHDDPHEKWGNDFRGIWFAYSLDPHSYVAMCTLCHRRFDAVFREARF